MEREPLRLDWSSDALDDLGRFAAFLLERGDAARAASIAAELIAKSRIVAEQPFIGRPVGQEGGYRQIALQALNATYIVRYRLNNGRPLVLRVFHGRERQD